MVLINFSILRKGLKITNRKTDISMPKEKGQTMF